MELVSALASGVADLRSVPEFAGALSAPARESFGVDVRSVPVCAFLSETALPARGSLQLGGRATGALAPCRDEVPLSRVSSFRERGDESNSFTRNLYVPSVVLTYCGSLLFGFMANVANRTPVEMYEPFESCSFAWRMCPTTLP